MYQAYEKFKDAWSIYDCYVSPGPIQFHDPSQLDVPYLVQPPNLEKLEELTNERIKLENEEIEMENEPYFRIGKCNLS